jgi:hypothetical protein
MIKYLFRFLMKTCQKHFICLILVVGDSTIEELREALEDVNHRLAGQARQQASIADQQPPLPPPQQQQQQQQQQNFPVKSNI